MEGNLWENISSEAKDLIANLLTYDYKRRPHAKNALEHPWFKNATKKPIDPEILKKALGNMQSFNAS